MGNYYVGKENIITILFEEKYLPVQNDNDWIDAFIETMDKHMKNNNNEFLQNSLLVLDHITSNTALTVPIKKISKIAKQKYNIGMVSVDGAHGLLIKDLNMKDDLCSKNGIDFYVSNAHKWMSSTRGCGFLYCNDKELREDVWRIPPVISHGIDDGFIRYVNVISLDEKF